MANRILIGAALGAVAATAYHKVKAAPGRGAEQKVNNLAEKANAKVDEAQRAAVEKVDVVEQAVSEGLKFAADAAHKFIGAGQERANGVSAGVKRVATDYAKQAAKEQLSKQAGRLFERISTEVKQAAEAAKAPAGKTPSPAPAAAPAASESAPTTLPPVPAMVRLEAERWVRDHRAEGVMGLIIDDERATVLFILKPDSQLVVPQEMVGYEVRAERMKLV